MKRGLKASFLAVRSRHRYRLAKATITKAKNEHIWKKYKLFPSSERRTWIPLADAAKALEDSPRTLRRRAANAEIPGARQASGRNGSWYFRRDLLERWYESPGA